MKIKHDFVTNSSSSSFIVTGKNTKEIAKKIISIIFKNNYIDLAIKEKAIKTIDKLNDNENIMIPYSCNYETFVSLAKNQKDIFIDTCNNHLWDDLDIIDYLGPDCGNYERYDEEIMHKDILKFINIDNGHTGDPNTLSKEIYNEIMEKFNREHKKE